MNKRKRTLFLFLILIVAGSMAAGCGLFKKRYPSRPPVEPTTPTPRLSGKSYVINGQRYWVLASAHGFVQDGLASWYGPNFHGRKTANGERYDMEAMTAAHKTLPLNTWVKVTNLENNRETIVRVNDRGPFVKGRVVDLSRAGARALGVLGPGTARVRVEALGTAGSQKVEGRIQQVLVQPDNYEVGQFTVQVGSFKEKSNAEALAGRLRRSYQPVTIQAFDRGDAVFYRVHVSEARTIGQALQMEARLEKQGFTDSFVVAR
ncbi:MAG: septal ring lytic transglycosylase RlpA family protein [Proteobacteria bacterium]|nr:septal ring lytic transglycosylase RlpA family protein [Pseudomonadota bacterium]